MTTLINADTSGGLKLTSDTSGNLDLQSAGSTKVAVTSSGASVTGEIALSSHLDMTDSGIIKLGSDDDLLIKHDGSNGSIVNSTGDLYLSDAGGNIYIQAKTGEQSIAAFADGAVDLYHNNAKKLETTATGVSVTGGLSLDSTSQSEWPMVHLDSQQLSGSYSQIDISISPTLAGYSAYKVIVSSWQLYAEGELWVNYGYGSNKKAGWYGGYYHVGEGNSSGQEGYGNQPQCEIVGTNTSSFSSNSYPLTGEFTFFPLEASNKGRIHYQAIARLNVGLSSSITGGGLSTNNSLADKIIFYSNQNTTRFHYKLYGIKI